MSTPTYQQWAAEREAEAKQQEAWGNHWLAQDVRRSITRAVYEATVGGEDR